MRARFAALAAVLLLAAGCEQTPEPTPPPVAVQPPAPPAGERGILLTVNFARDSWVIAPESKPALDNVAQAMKDSRLAGTRYLVQGHTDASGRLGHNLSLSKLRAAAVTDYLVAKGVERERLQSEGFGPLRLLDPAQPRNPANRRVEIVSTR